MTATTATPTDSRAALLGWAGRDGRFNRDDVQAILNGHGETFSSWADHCFTYDVYVFSAEALLIWLGY
jgi:hypothetical protein